jgi:membrane fusion protein, adhesin transport system
MKSLVHKSTAYTDAMPRFRLGIWGGLVALILFLVWAYHAEIDQITRGSGQIIPSSRSQIIQAADGGVLQALLVREGDQVERGQLIAQLDRTKAEAGYRESQARVAALSTQVARLRAEIDGGSPTFGAETQGFAEFKRNQASLLQTRRDAFAEEILVLERLRSIAQRELEMAEPLLQSGDLSMADVMRLQRQVAELDGQLSNRRNKYQQELHAELTTAQEELASARETLIQRRDLLANTLLHAPSSGTVTNVRVTTLGGVLRPGDELMHIVPVEDVLVVEARVTPADVAYLRPGQFVSVKIDAYDFTIYGGLDGELTYISADTLSEDLRHGEQPYYRVQVVTKEPRFARRPDEAILLQPGMTATIEVKTGQNTVFNYLLKPVIKTFSQSLGER